MTGEVPTRGLLDTNVLIPRRWIPDELLPAEVAISAITLAELSAGPHQVHEFDPIPFDIEAARVFGRVTAAVIAAGRTPRRGADRAGGLAERRT